MATQEQTKQTALQEGILYTKCEELYRKMFPHLEQLGWVDLEHYGFAMYAKVVDGVEYILNMDMASLLVQDREQGETPEAINLRREIESLPEWVELREPVKKWKEFRTKYWLSSSLS